jgi:5'-methylthioinosine phosphorylase
MNRVAIVAGTGASGLVSDQVDRREIETPYGDPSSPVMTWQSGDTEFSFIARHGLDSVIPPHRVNYRANVWALRETRPEFIVAVNAVGGIEPNAIPGRLVFPDQLVDYTWGREHTYSDGLSSPLKHIDFTEPFSEAVRARLIAAAEGLALEYSASGTYAVTQGPRLETAAEIDRLERDGCHVVGMTAMPEAALARELEMDYAICAIVVNWAAGRNLSGADIHDEMSRHVDQGMDRVGRLLRAL